MRTSARAFWTICVFKLLTRKLKDSKAQSYRHRFLVQDSGDGG
jgi:hypothetical protein